MRFRDVPTSEKGLVLYGTIPIPLKIRDRTIYVYDYELAIMIMKSWMEQGMTKDEVFDFMLEVEESIKY